MSTNNMSNFLYGIQSNRLSEKDKSGRHWIIDLIRNSEHFRDHSSATYDRYIKDGLIALGDTALFREMLNRNNTHNCGCILTRNLMQEINAIVGIISKEQRSTELVIDDPEYGEEENNLDQIKDVQCRLNKAISTLDFKIFDLAIDRLEQRLIFGASYIYYYIGENEKIKYRLLDALQVYESCDNDSYLYIYEDYEDVSHIQMTYGIDQNKINEIRDMYNNNDYEYSTFYNNSYKEYLINSYNEFMVGKNSETSESIMMYLPKSGDYIRKKVILDSVDKLFVLHAFVSTLSTTIEIVDNRTIKTAKTICRHLVFMADQLVFSEDLGNYPPIVKLGKKIIKNSSTYGYRGIAFSCLAHVLSYSAVLSRSIDGCVNSPAKKLFIKTGVLRDKKTNVSSSLKNTVIQVSNTDDSIGNNVMATDLGLIDQSSIGFLSYLQEAIRLSAGLLDMTQLTASAEQEQLRLNIQENSLSTYSTDVVEFMKKSTKVISSLFTQLLEDIPDDIHENMSVRVRLSRYSETYYMSQLNKLMTLSRLTGTGVNIPMKTLFKLLDIDEKIQNDVIGTMEGQTEQAELQMRSAISEVENKEADTILKKAGAMQKTADAIVTLKHNGE